MPENRDRQLRNHFKNHFPDLWGENHEDQCTRLQAPSCPSKGPVSTEVVISIGAGNERVSSITTTSAENLKLKAGSKVYAGVKASEVMIAVD